MRKRTKRGTVKERNRLSALRKARSMNTALFNRKYLLDVELISDHPMKYGMWKYKVYAIKRKS